MVGPPVLSRHPGAPTTSSPSKAGLTGVGTEVSTVLSISHARSSWAGSPVENQRFREDQSGLVTAFCASCGKSRRQLNLDLFQSLIMLCIANRVRNAKHFLDRQAFMV
jgi:hypothetical protein